MYELPRLSNRLSRTCGGKPPITDSFLENVVLKVLQSKVLSMYKRSLSP
jgi:hypothetical protein